MNEFINQELNRQSYGYEIPKRLTDKCWLICPIGNHNVEGTMRSLARTFKKRGTYRCLKCFSKSQESRDIKSKISKSLWENKEFADRIILKSKEVANSLVGKKQRSEQAKAAWKSEDYSELQRIRIQEQFKSGKHRKLVSELNIKSYREDPEKYLKEKCSALFTELAKKNHREAVSRPEYRAKHRELAKERFLNDEYKSKIAKGLEEFPRGGKMSSPECEVKKILDSLDIKYTYNKAVGPYNFDFHLEALNIFIEIQGEYWHSLPNNERRDLSKYTYLRTAFPESRIIYIWDYDFKSGNAEDKLKGILGLKSREFDFKECVNRIVNVQDAKGLLNTWHYAQYGKAGKFIFGAYLNDQLIAVAKIGPVGRKEVATSMGFTTKECYELDRFCIHPFYQKKNLGSFLLGSTTREFFNLYIEAKAIVSFADSTFGHEGTIYKASNWKEIGKVKPDYVYRSDDGRMMHKKTLYNQAASVHMTEAAYVEKHGYQKIYGKEKTKFILKRPDR